MEKKTYVLITPAKNEEANIEKTILSVISQTILPMKWLIVNDGSTDRTADIVLKYSSKSKYSFIQLVNLQQGNERSFVSKIRAFNTGYEKLKEVDYEFIGNLDADISFDPYYYENIIKKFDAYQNLGIIGGVVYDIINSKFDTSRLHSLDDVAGGVLVFRRKCYEEINGYRLLPWGGEDFVAETMARQHGWKVRAFPDIIAYHNKATGSAIARNYLNLRFFEGLRDYSLGYHPLFFLVKCLSRIFHKPFLIGGLIGEFGYLWAKLRYSKRSLSTDFVKFVRQEQLIKLKSRLSNLGIHRDTNPG